MRICYQLALLVLVNTVLGYSTYEGHKIIRVTPETDEHFRKLRSIEDVLGYEPDFISNIHGLGRSGDMVVPPEHVESTLQFIDQAGIKFDILQNNLAEAVHRERRAVKRSISQAENNEQLIETTYLSFDEQMRIVDELVAQHPQKARIQTVGTSTEGRPIKEITIGYPSARNLSKPILWIDAGIHAREWIAPSVALYAIHHLLNDRRYIRLLHRIDIVVLPNVNPDGYEFSRLHERLWRKTRTIQPATQCVGVDANRNFPFHWGQEGVSYSPCRENYCGKEVLSEPECRTIVTQMTNNKNRIKAYITLHSYGQDILYPWGHTINAYPDDVDELIRMANRIAAAIRTVRGTNYTVANSAGGLYPASGASDDWAKSIGIKYSYTIELTPNTEYYGFELPPRFIKGVCEDTLKGLIEMAKQVARYPSTSTINRPDIATSSDPNKNTPVDAVKSTSSFATFLNSH